LNGGCAGDQHVAGLHLLVQRHEQLLSILAPAAPLPPSSS
jgi:hypothetical protein